MTTFILYRTNIGKTSQKLLYAAMLTEIQNDKIYQRCASLRCLCISR